MQTVHSRTSLAAWTILAAASTLAIQTSNPLEWLPQTSGVAARLRGVTAVSDSVAWASGTNGTVLRTSDGGATWRQLYVPGASELDFRDIDGIDERTAFVLSIGPGEASRIYKTSDAGATWDQQFVNRDPKAFFDAMAFWDADNGIAFSDSVDGRFVIVMTRNGGRMWTSVPDAALPPALPNEAAFAASGTSVAVQSGGAIWIGTGGASASRVLRSGDGGKTWSIASTPLPSGPSAGIFSVAFRGSTHGIVVGGDYKKEGDAVDNAAITTDGGIAWTVVKGLRGYRSAVAYMRRGVIAVGPTGADYSVDDGRTWTPTGTMTGLHAVSITRTGTVGWAVGEEGRIVKLKLRTRD